MPSELDSSLANLMGAYYHQDWPDYGDSSFSPLDDFLSECPRALVEQLRDEVGDLLRTSAGDIDLLNKLRDLSGNLVAADMPNGARSWLTEMRDRIDQFLVTHRHATSREQRSAG